MSAITLWHNPRCSKSRQALELLRERGAETEVVEYLKQPPSEAQIERVLTLLGREPRDLMRKGEAAYKEQGLDRDSLSRGELVAAMAAHPILIERPVAVRGERAALGRPPENVLALIEG